MSVIPSVYFFRPNVPHCLYWETELIPAISNVRMYKETVSYWFMVGWHHHFPESGFFMFDEMKEGAPQFIL